MDGLAIAAAMSEMKQVVKGSVIRSIYQPSPTRFVWRLFSRGTVRLFIAPAEATIQLTKLDFAYPKQPSPFAMLLRKYLRGGRIVEFSQQGLERVVRIMVEKRMAEGLEIVEVIVELVGVQGNLILVKDNVVVGSLRSKARAIPGKKYMPLPKQDKLDPRTVTAALIQEALEKNDSARTLVRTIDGVGKETARIVYAQAKKRSTQPFAQALKQKLDSIVQHISQPLGTYDAENNSAFFFPVDGMESHSSFGRALDRRLEHREEVLQADEGTHEIRAAAKRAIARTKKTIGKLEKWLESAEYADNLQHQADLLMIYHRDVPRKASQITLTDPATTNHEKIPLDPRRSGLENAQALYNQAKRLRRGRKLVSQKLDRLQEEIRLLEEGIDKVENGQSMPDRAVALLPDFEVKKESRSQTACRTYSISGYTVRVGKNAQQNDELLRGARPNDLWLHARDVPGSHVVISRHGQEDIANEVITEAAQLAARHSKSRHEKHVAVSVAQVKHVRKPKGAPAGLVILRQEDTLVVDVSDVEER